MCKFEKVKFIENKFEGKSYLAAKILIHISPTLFGLKPATLINFSKQKNKDLIKLWDLYKSELSSIEGIEVFELKRTEENLIVFFYNRQDLERIIFKKQNLRFLSGFGYNGETGIENMLLFLKSRYGDSCPHEIGLFLGIPLKDILGYLQLLPLSCSYCGYWKVYGNPQKSIILFQKFRVIKEKVFQLIYSEEDPLKILSQPYLYFNLVNETESWQEVS